MQVLGEGEGEGEAEAEAEEREERLLTFTLFPSHSCSLQQARKWSM